MKLRKKMGIELAISFVFIIGAPREWGGGKKLPKLPKIAEIEKP
jgi:hypothetical protein